MDSSNKIEIRITSDLDYENLIAEITANGKFIGLISNEPKKSLCFEAPNGKGGFNSIELECFKAVLDNAKKNCFKNRRYRTRKTGRKEQGGAARLVGAND